MANLSLQWLLLCLSIFHRTSTAVTQQQTLTNGSHFGYIIVGGGTCGLVLASRLSDDPAISVAVVEAGDSVRFNPNVTNTTVFGLSLGTSIDWAYPSEGQEFADGKSVVYHAGKALGGTSTINGGFCALTILVV
jgi:choline dehydrogenase-like flavoprotein